MEALPVEGIALSCCSLLARVTTRQAQSDDIDRSRGGRRVCLCREDGDREVVKPERLAFTWAWEDEEGKPKHETVVRVDFTEQGGKTRLRMQQGVFESANARDQHESGWSSSLDDLADYLREIARDGRPQ